jgi:hypothetical protein
MRSAMQDLGLNRIDLLQATNKRFPLTKNIRAWPSRAC